MTAVLARSFVASPILGDYSLKHFQNLPTLEAAKDSFLVKGKGDQVVADTIKNFFVQYGMERTFGLAMTHRHFDLESNEKLVDYRGTSTPWQALVPGMKEPQAAIWAFDEDDIPRPTEFYYSETVDAPLSENALAFIGKFNVFLKELNLVKILGLARARCSIGYIAYALRVYTRLRYSPWGIEDWCMTAALPCFTVLSIGCIACAFTGIGATNATLALSENAGYQETGLFWFFIFEVFYCVNIIPVKLSISLALIRIAENRKRYIYVQYGVMTMFIIMNLIAGFYIIFHCNPVSAAWDPSALENGGKCNPPQYLADIYYATTAVNIFTDWVTAFMPIPLLWSVQLNRNTKLSVLCVLGLGFFASISACVRLKYTVNLTAQENYLYALADIVIWGYAENGLGLIVGCAMTLRPLFRGILNLGGDTSHKQSNGISSARYGFGSNLQRRAYQEGENGYELPGESRHSASSSNGYGNNMTLTQILGGKKSKKEDSSSFDTESQKKIFVVGDEEAAGGIMVTRDVKLSRNVGIE